MPYIKKSYGLGRLIVVADKGLNSAKNIDVIVNNGDGFVFSQILKGKKGQRYNEKLFNEGGWTSNEGGTYRSAKKPVISTTMGFLPFLKL
jgi:hypothetical protein